MKNTLSQITLSAAIALLLGAASSPGDVWIGYTGEGTSPNDDTDGPAEDMFVADGAQNGTGSVSGTGEFQNGEYNHFALTYDDGDVILYLNASVIGNGNVGAGSMDLAADITVGWSSNNTLVGWMDDILILDHVLTQEEIVNHRDSGNSAIVVPEPSSVALLGIGALVLGWARRRSSARK